MELETYYSYMETTKQQLIQLAEPVILNTVFFINRKWIHTLRFCEWLYKTHLVHYPVIEYTMIYIYMVYILFHGAIKEIYEDLIYFDREPKHPFLARIHIEHLSNDTLTLKTVCDKYDTIIKEMPALTEENENNEFSKDFIMEDRYDITHTFDEINKQVDEYYHESRSLANALEPHEKLNHEVLLISKDYYDRYCSRVFTGESLTPEQYKWSAPIESEVGFLSITYSHPKMKEPIEINLSPKYLFVGNQILSRTFIAKYMCQQSIFTNYIFDQNYTVDIMDNELNQVQLGWNNYLLIEKDSYKVITREESPQISESHSSSDEDDIPPPLIPIDEEESNTVEKTEPELIETSDGDDGVIISHTPNPSDETDNR